MRGIDDKQQSQFSDLSTEDPSATGMAKREAALQMLRRTVRVRTQHAPTMATISLRCQKEIGTPGRRKLRGLDSKR